MHPTLGNLSTPKAIGDTRLAKRSDTIAGKPLFMCLLSFRTNARIMTLTLDSPFGIADGGWRMADRRSQIGQIPCRFIFACLCDASFPVGIFWSAGRGSLNHLPSGSCMYVTISNFQRSVRAARWQGVGKGNPPPGDTCRGWGNPYGSSFQLATRM